MKYSSEDTSRLLSEWRERKPNLHVIVWSTLVHLNSVRSTITDASDASVSIDFDLPNRGPLTLHFQSALTEYFQTTSEAPFEKPIQEPDQYNGWLKLRFAHPLGDHVMIGEFKQASRSTAA